MSPAFSIARYPFRSSSVRQLEPQNAVTFWLMPMFCIFCILIGEIFGEEPLPLQTWSIWLGCPLRVGFRLAIDGTDSAEGVVLDGNRFSPVDPALHP